MNKKIKFAIIGCGRIAPKHIESLQQISEAEVVALCEIKQDRLEKTSKKYAIKSFSSISSLLSWGDFDVACICTPSGNHADHAVEFLRMKKHVVVEKPMALTVEDADRMIAESEKNGVRLFVVKQNRYNPPVVALRKALNEGRFGKLNLGTVRVRWMRDQNYYNQDSWRGTWALDGGVFSNQASHHIDLLEWCMGDVDTVYAKTATQMVKIECEDTGIAILKFKSGALGLIEATTATRPKDLEGSVSILGEKGTVEISGFAVNELRHFQFVEERSEDANIRNAQFEKPSSVYGFGHLAYLKNVVDVLKGRADPIVDGYEGKKSLLMITALYESAQTGKEIKVGSPTPNCKLGK